MIEAVIILDNKLSHYTVWFAKWRRLIDCKTLLVGAYDTDLEDKCCAWIVADFQDEYGD